MRYNIEIGGEKVLEVPTFPSNPFEDTLYHRIRFEEPIVVSAMQKI